MTGYKKPTKRYKVCGLVVLLMGYLNTISNISTNNTAIGLVRVRKIRFQPTKYVFVRRCARSRRSFVPVMLAQKFRPCLDRIHKKKTLNRINVTAAAIQLAVRHLKQS
jgi:hypothetical protein